MSNKYYRLEDTIRFGVTTTNPSGGALTDADSIPRWSVFEDAGDTPILQDDFGKRVGLEGTYRGFFDASGVTGFESGKYYEIQASGAVDSVEGRAIILNFELDDIFDSNLLQVNGVAVTLNEFRAPPSGVAFAVWDEILIGNTHNIVNSAGRRLRQIQERGTYEDGLVWLDTVGGTAGTTDFENGTVVKPVLTIVDGNTIKSSLTLHGFHVAAGNTVTFAAAQTNEEWTGDGWTLVLASQNIAGSHFVGAEISGISTGAASFDHCHLNICSFAGGEFLTCGFQDTITITAATDYQFIDCYHAEMGGASTLDFGSAVGASEVHIHNWHGNLTILNMDTDDILHFTSSNGALTLDSTCTAGTLNHAGTFGLTDNSIGTTINNLGNVYERVGAPVGVDISADIAALPTASGIADDVWDEDITEHTITNSAGEQMQPAYFADIKFIKDNVNDQDEYSVCWLRNSELLGSGDITDPAISVYNTVNGTAIFEDQTLDYVNVALGALRFNETTSLLTSGEPYLVLTSGVIDSANRDWKLLIGLDS